MPSMNEAYKAFKMNGSGCIFEHCGQIPETIYHVNENCSPLERAVFEKDLDKCVQCIENGEVVSVRCKIGQMACLEYAAMRGCADILQLLLDHSINANILHQYFALDDVVERAYMISRNKDVFFAREALAEANRYEAALYTAVAYNQPDCVRLMLKYLSPRELKKNMFFTNVNNKQCSLTASELAQIKGHTECYELLSKCEMQHEDSLLSRSAPC